MKNLLIVDLEATCYADGQEPPGFTSEIIEIGAVVFETATRRTAREYQSFVRPTESPTLSAFCVELTTITQAEVERGVTLADGLAGLRALYEPERAVFASWGYYDQRQIERECRRKGVPYPFAPAHISLKHAHAGFYHLARPLGMDEALARAGLPLHGTHHRALDDVRNIAQIAARMLDDGWTDAALD